MRPIGALVVLWLVISLMVSASGQAAETSLRQVIDEQIETAWNAQKIEPAQPADDAAFLRRIYLDIVGVIPTHDEAATFLDDKDPEKRSKLIDRLLDDPRYAMHQADIWDVILFTRNPDSNEVRIRPSFQHWLREQFAQNVSYRDLVNKLIRGEGNSVDDGAPMYLAQFARRPEDASQTITQTFLGVQLQCARCHDHPFEKWTQRDFYGMAAFMARTEVVSLGKNGQEPKYAVGERNRGDILFSGPAKDQTPGKKGEPIMAKFLQGDSLKEPEIPADVQDPRNFPSNVVPASPRFSRRNALADWMTQPDNAYLAKSISNRLWAQYLGRGIVHPIDNLSEANPPSHPELLNILSREMVAFNFDMKRFIRELCNTRTYQLASDGALEELRPRLFERARIRPLAAEELAASWRIATGYESTAATKKSGADPRFVGMTREYMMRFFGEPSNGSGDFQGGLQEHLYLNNGEVSNLITREPGGLLAQVSDKNTPVGLRVERLFLSVLSRRPNAAEASQFAEVLAENSPKRESASLDVIWALMTCSEFRFNH